jgi:uncharacterized protein YjbI with pentapeptide repeats
MSDVKLDKKDSNNRDITALFVLIILIIMIISIIVINTYGYLCPLKWVGVVDYQSIEFRTLWDWMELLLIPIVLSFGAFLLTRAEKNHERKLETQRRQTNIQIAHDREMVDRELEKDRLEQKSLDQYFDVLSELLLEHKLRESNIDDEVRTIARTRTLTILLDLNGKRKGLLIQFLYEANLIAGRNPIIDMSYSDLSELQLPYSHLDHISLPKSNLRNSNLYFAKLQGANFYHSDLDEANLRWADLRNADLRCGLIETKLGVAKLQGANLERANLNGADLTNSKLDGASFRSANLKYKNPSLGDIEPNNIQYADLSLADIRNCDFTDAKIDKEQIIRAKNISSAILPDTINFSDLR